MVIKMPKKPHDEIILLLGIILIAALFCAIQGCSLNREVEYIAQGDDISTVYGNGDAAIRVRKITQLNFLLPGGKQDDVSNDDGQ